MNEDYLEKLKRVKIMDDEFGRIVFKDRACALEVLKTIEIIDDNTNIIHYETQADLKVLTNRSVVFDVMVVSDKGYIDIELEKKRERANPFRARYHSSLADVHMNEPNDEIVELPENIIIFLCSFDYYHAGLPKYTIKRTVKELGIDYGDKSKIIYVNGTYRGNDKIGRLMSDLMCTDPDDIHNEVLKQRVKYFKEDEGGQREMCEIWEEIKLEGEFKGKLTSLKSLMETMNLSLEDAMNALKLTEEEKQMCREKLQ